MTRISDWRPLWGKVPGRPGRLTMSGRSYEPQPSLPTQALMSSTPKLVSDRDRREATRHEVEIEVTMESEHNFYTGLTQDVSTGGLFIATHQLRPIGEQIRLKFSLPGGGAPLDILTEVRWHRDTRAIRTDGHAGMGVKFLNLSGEHQKAIEAFLADRDSLFFDDE